jgi:glycosyltransferase involved in cell wall biosynthesis
MKKISILQTPPRFYPYIGGTENHVYHLSKELIKDGYAVKVICANEPKSTNKKIEGISIERLAYPFKVTNTTITPYLPISILKSKFDILHTHMPTPWSSDVSILFAKIMKKKSIITIHNDMDKSSFISKLVTKIYLYTFYKLSLALVDKIIIINPNWETSFTATRNILKNYKQKISVIPNGIDLSLFKKTRKDTRNKNKLLFVSLLDKYHSFKGIDYLLEAVKIAKNSISDIDLDIIGEGELKEYYQKKSKKLHIQNNVHFIGEVKHTDLVSHYNNASLFILPSTEIEGFGIVLLEAMACALPVIATDIVGTSKDIKKYNAGIIVKPKDAQLLANAILELLKNQKKAKLMGANGRKLVETNYDWGEIAKRIEKLYTV